MSIFSYILLLSYLAGLNGDFNPDSIINYCENDFALLVLEIVIIKMVSYGLGYPNIGIIDIIALVSYKNVHLCLLGILKNFLPYLLYNIAMVYCIVAYFFFFV